MTKKRMNLSSPAFLKRNSFIDVILFFTISWYSFWDIPRDEDIEDIEGRKPGGESLKFQQDSF